MSPIRWKGELADGHVHMTAQEFWEHRTKESNEAHRQYLRKIANNPILTKEVQEAIRYAIYAIDNNTWLMKTNDELRETISNMKKARKQL